MATVVLRSAWLLGLFVAGGFACSPSPGDSAGGTGGANGGGAVGGQSASGAQGNSGGQATGGGNSGGSSGASGGAGNLGGEGPNAGGNNTGGEFAGLGGTFFQGGSKLVIPHRERDLLIFVAPDLTELPLDAELPEGTMRIIDAEGYSREHLFSVDLTFFIDTERCLAAINGQFTIDKLTVTEDLDGSGAELSVEPNGEAYTLRHEGLGRHELQVEGTFVANDPSLCPERLNEEGEMAVSFQRTILVEPLVGARFAFAEDCAASPRVLSGQGFPGSSFLMVDADGKDIYADNVDSAYPVDVTIETEKDAEITPPETALSSGGVKISGEPQLVRLSSPFGTLAIYDLVSLSQVEDWNIRFYANGGLGGINVTELESGETYSIADAPADELRADLQLLIEDQPLCSYLPEDDFVTTANTPSVCTQGGFTSTEGPVFGMFNPTGACSFSVTLPDAHSGDGLEATLSATFVEE